MELYIGGYAQGKRDYVLSTHSGTWKIFDGTKIPEAMDEKEDKILLDHLHLFIEDRLLKKADPLEEILKIVEAHPKCIILCDEIGNGIVPMEKEKREYRDRTGQILIRLSKEAKRVERIVCGLGQRIK